MTCRACGITREADGLLLVSGKFYVCRPSLWDEDEARPAYRPLPVPCFRVVTCERERQPITLAT